MNEFKKAFRGVDQAIKQGTARALNRALSSTKTQVVRKLREDTGLKTEVINSRIRSKSAKQNLLGIIIGIAVKFDIALSKFSPKERTVRRGKRVYQGVTVKLGPNARALSPGAFFLQGKTVDGVVIKRKGIEKYPTMTPKTDVFKKSAIDAQGPAIKTMQDVFDARVAHEIDFAIQNKFKSNK